MALYELQKIDSKIDEINKVKGELPLEVQDLEDEMAGMKTRIEHINAEIEELNTLTKQRKREVDQAKIMIGNYKEQQNNVRNNREFDAITKEIEYQELEIELAEKRLKEYSAGVKAKKLQLEEAENLSVERAADLAAKKAELSEAHKAAVAKALAERTAIVEKAEALANSLGDNTNWRSIADKFRSLFQQWQDHKHNSVRLDKADADALWSRFSSARTTFNSARRKWAQGRDEERSNAKAAKEAIIAEAEEIKDSTAWMETSRKFNELMDRWKKAGRAGRRDDDALWARFRAAADTFFNARQADREQISSSEKENLAKKEELLTKAEALVPVKDEKAAKQARQALAAIQEEWDQIGYVPRDDMHRIESRLDAVDKQIKAVEDAAWKQSDPEADARKSSFEEQLNAQLAELDAQITAESDPKKKAKLEAEKATKEQWLNAIK